MRVSWVKSSTRIKRTDLDPHSPQCLDNGRLYLANFVAHHLKMWIITMNGSFHPLNGKMPYRA
jgi:hypothetical protein